MGRSVSAGSNRSAFLIIVATILTGWIIFEYIQATRGLFEGFPEIYTWTELLLNYQGGIIKRAALGEIAYHIDHWIPAQYFVTAIIVALWSVCIIGMIWVLRISGTFAGLLFLVSPAGILFPIYDQQAFGRKDLFIWMVAVVAAIASTQIRNSKLSLAIILSTAAIATAFSETVMFYLPLIFWGFLASRREESLRFRWTAASIAAAVTIGGLVANYLLKSTDEKLIAASWQAIYPTAYENAGALCCLGMNLSQALQITRELEIQAQPRDTYLLGMALAMLPTLALFWSRKPRRSWTALGTACLFAGLASALAPLILAADWGRFISLFTSVLFLSTWSALSGEPLRQGWLLKSDRRPAIVIGLVVATAVFAGSWRMHHWRPPGEYGLMPGPILNWLDAS